MVISTDRTTVQSTLIHTDTQNRIMSKRLQLVNNNNNNLLFQMYRPINDKFDITRNDDKEASSFESIVCFRKTENESKRFGDKKSRRKIRKQEKWRMLPSCQHGNSEESKNVKNRCHILYHSCRNERERQRVQSVNYGFYKLRSKLPFGHQETKKRLSKLEVLRATITYINHLQNLLNSLNE
ncbi:ASCL4 (predicted) [Pycnogonum litorale]